MNGVNFKSLSNEKNIKSSLKILALAVNVIQTLN